MFAVIGGGIVFLLLVLIAPMRVVRWRSGTVLIEPYCLPEETPRAVSNDAVRIGDSDAVLPIRLGLPDFAAAIAEAEGDVISAYASGPQGMNHALRCAANGVNTAFEKRYADFCKMPSAL